ncbi:MAG: ribokinase [bacterium]|nr:ribokinase [bacterium]
MAPVICVVGSINVDLVTRVPRIPAPGETITGGDLATTFGGKGANQAVMAARLGAHVRMIGRVGRDSFGDDIAANFQAEGVNGAFVLRDARATGVALISVDTVTGQNTIVVAPGANQALSPDDVRQAADVIRTADVVIAQLETPPEATIEAFRLARRAPKPPITIFNPAPANLFPPELYTLADVITPNEFEAALIAGAPPITTDADALAAGRAIQERGGQTVVVTLGERGALLIDPSGAAVTIPVEKVQAVDTVGAGDAFTGALGYFLGMGIAMPEAVRRACAIASLSVLKPGAMASFPRRAEVPHLV